ncbi:DnaJ-domain-containing protein [Aureobasidium pullulans]|uniref:DnaJ-domain-containing protein n=1 Tax=Aureobasidium pullulans TaxID=5580 RepID=A0A4S9BGB1_AURPU|nr:DnaJ-domain-containing protein [Aureobasidium pullulans]
MPGDDDLIEAAKSTAVDYYDLLGITFENSSESDIRRAYRRTALKYHPDKNADKPDIVEKFHLLQIANDVLSSPEYKAIYDNARRVKQEKEERHQAFEGRRRQMKEDLENRENASLKRKHQEEEEGDKLQREIQRLAADGKRRRLERQEQLNRERLEEEERLDREKNGYISPQQSAPKTGTGVSDIDRSVKVVWSKDGLGAEIDKDRLKVMFTTFGKLQDVAVLKEKKKRIGESKSKSLVASALIVYESVVGAHAAISDYKKRSDSDPDFKAFDSVYWASNKEPDFLQRPSTPVPSTPGSDKPSTQRPLRDIPGLDSPITPLKQSGGGLRKVPSFASFSSAKNSPVATSASSPSLEELTMIRLKNAEKRRLEEQIRKEEAGEED